MKSRLKITIQELPVRAKSLTEAELAGVFGGCKYSGYCEGSSYCCPGLLCYKTADGWLCQPFHGFQNSF